MGRESGVDVFFHDVEKARKIAVRMRVKAVQSTGYSETGSAEVVRESVW